ncbi:hypothetical protein J4526_03400 [Desulfurococcaceae archaeon MEX13E-LK6-19]|nr:hypothetical protein J4526_03400 [Desulfurococcaceae archaeon MEX13E-LK6-19]
MKKEARILFLKECSRGYAFIVCRGKSIEEISIHRGYDLREGLKKLKTLEEIRYFYCIDSCEQGVIGSLGIKCIRYSVLDPDILFNIKRVLSSLCYIIDVFGKSKPISVTHVCISKSY